MKTYDKDHGMLAASLRMFTGALPPGYADEKEFFVTSFLTMSEYLAHLQKEMFDALCNNFLGSVDAGKATPEIIQKFKADLGRLITAPDLRKLDAGMAGSKEFIKHMLAAITPLSLIAEEKKESGRDPEAERRITEIYARLKFDALAMKVKALPSDASANAALAEARKDITSYCGLQGIPMGDSSVLTPFYLYCMDAALAAIYRLYKSIRQSTGRSL